MKQLFSSLLIIATSCSYINAQTTLCYKEANNSMSNSEKIKLDGGECKGLLTIEDMKKKGWHIDDIKISESNNKYNFIYILKNTSNNTNLIEYSKDLEERILEKIEKQNIIKKKTEAKKIQENKILEGKVKYQNSCQSCHGMKGENEYSTSRVINKLSISEFKRTIRNYNNGEYDRGQAMVMYPYVSTITDEDIENIYHYLKKINQ